jgi:DNA-binding NtrC family response regulator
MTRKILLVDADSSSLEQCTRVLRDCACEVHEANSCNTAITLLGGKKFYALIADFRLVSAGGCDLLTAARRIQPEIRIILTVEGIGNAPPHYPLSLRGYPLLTKPLQIQELTRQLDNSPEAPVSPTQDQKTQDLVSSPAEFAGLVGGSEKMRKIYRLISKVAMQRHPVLITGESGTGKELVARAIHTHGSWRDQPFVPIDCGALPATLIESELFGHVKGAFTGAAQSRQGLLAAAGSGTVFLDEIGELPIELQSRLLRALQEHEIRPLGSNEPTRFEARIVAATNQNLEDAVKRGVFRRDLFFRLNVVSIKMPSLRERKEDIPALARHFLAHLEDGDSLRQFADEVLGSLMAYDWPGNVRELQNCIQHAVTLGSGKFIELRDLPSTMLYRAVRRSSSRRDPANLEMLELQAIRQALQSTGGDRIRAAKMLGIGKTTIYRKIKEYGLDATSAET